MATDPEPPHLTRSDNHDRGSRTDPRPARRATPRQQSPPPPPPEARRRHSISASMHITQWPRSATEPRLPNGSTHSKPRSSQDTRRSGELARTNRLQARTRSPRRRASLVTRYPPSQGRAGGCASQDRRTVDLCETAREVEVGAIRHGRSRLHRGPVPASPRPAHWCWPRAGSPRTVSLVPPLHVALVYAVRCIATCMKPFMRNAGARACRPTSCWSRVLRKHRTSSKRSPTARTVRALWVVIVTDDAKGKSMNARPLHFVPPADFASA